MIKHLSKTIILTIVMMLGIFSVHAQYVEVTSPASVSGNYDFGISIFGAALNKCGDFTLTANLAAGTQADGESTACDAGGEITSEVAGKIAVIDRGDCDFTEKVLNAQNAGALAVLVCNNDPDGDPINMSGEADNITIPGIMFSFADCQTIRSIPEYESGEITLLLKDSLTTVPIDEFGTEEPLWETTFNGGLDGWTSTSISCLGTSSEDATWEWVSEDNFSRGAYSQGARLISFSPCDGAVVFDSDFLDNGGVLDAFGEGTCATDRDNKQEAYLISPEIDLSNYSFEGLPTLKFTNMFRHFNSEYFLGWSVDQGLTWSEQQVNGNVEDDDLNVNTQRILLNNVPLDSKVMFRFRILGNYYYWGVDDVKLVDFSGTNARIFNSFYTPLSYAVPIAHADADTFVFVTSVINESPNNLNTVRFDVEIKNDASDDVVYSNSTMVTDVEPLDTVTIAIDDLYVPNMLEVGVYRMEYNLTLVDQAEDISTDNSEVYTYEITENTFAKENGATTGLNPGVSGEWYAGTLYKLSPNVDDVDVMSVSLVIDSNGDILTDNYLDVYLLQLKDGVYEDFNSFDFDESDIFSHPSFDIINQTTHIFTDELPGDLITIPINPEDESVRLETGGAFMVLVGFDQGQEGQALVPNSNLFLGYNEDIISGTISDFILDPNGGGWFTGFEGDPAPVIRLNLGMTSSADELALPEGTFEVLPNPAHNIAQAKLNFERPMDAQLIIANLEGRILFMKNLNQVQTTTEEINVSQLPSGTYLIRIATEEGTKTQKIVIQH